MTPSEALDFWQAYQEAPSRPLTPEPTPPKVRVYNPTYSEVTDTFTAATSENLYFGIDALAAWRQR